MLLMQKLLQIVNHIQKKWMHRGLQQKVVVYWLNFYWTFFYLTAWSMQQKRSEHSSSWTSWNVLCHSFTSKCPSKLCVTKYGGGIASEIILYYFSPHELCWGKDAKASNSSPLVIHFVFISYTYFWVQDELFKSQMCWKNLNFLSTGAGLSYKQAQF